MATSPAASRIRPSHGEPSPPLNQELIVDEILTRLPVAAAVRCRSVCRAWNAALASGHFVAAHAARAAAARHPEIVFFSPTEKGVATSFYACSLPEDGDAPPAAAARKLLSVGNLAGEHLVLTGKPCRGLTLVFDVRLSEYHVLNLSTGEHVSLPPCETAEEIAPVVPKLMLLKRFPLELSSTGLGFDPATGQHKVVRLFRNIFGQQKCEVCSLTASGEWRWRRCAGGNAPPRFACYVDGRPPVALDGSLYWLLHRRGCADDGSASWDPQQDAPILSLSVGAERFGWVRTPPRLASRIRHLTNLDGSLCAVVHDRLVDDVLLLVTWSPSSPSWSARCRIDVGSLPRPIRDELSGEREIVPLCSVKKKILLATSRHKVYAYDTEQGAAEEVFDMNRFVDVPPHNSESRLFVNIGLHEEDIGPKLAGDKWLQVKRGRDMVIGKREAASSAYQLEHRDHDEGFHRTREVIMQLAFPT
ncbi:putative F-box/kelch-repeat protein At1g12870 [Aegilops tauschii subsp. strangulata]|nr:uncharacterized protein LOC109773240 [Aegilops tauschii subsp. strangulata]XP_044401889.1 uncharacterized protein LOC123125468 [Triticum aestivum]